MLFSTDVAIEVASMTVDAIEKMDSVDNDGCNDVA